MSWDTMQGNVASDHMLKRVFVLFFLRRNNRKLKKKKRERQNKTLSMPGLTLEQKPLEDSGTKLKNKIKA